MSMIDCWTALCEIKQLCLCAYKKATSKVLCTIRGMIEYEEPRIMFSLYETLVRLHVEYCSSAWSPFCKISCWRKFNIYSEK